MFDKRELAAASFLVVMSSSIGACDSGSSGETPPAAETGVVDADATADVDGAADAAQQDGGGAPRLAIGRMDRAGRAAITVALVSDPQADTYNRASTFPTDGGVAATSFAPIFQSRLVPWDLMDSVPDWDAGSPDGGSDGGLAVYPHALIPTLSLDVIIVDTSKPFSANGYLDVEYSAIVSGTPGAHTTSGGRWLDEDVIDKTLSLFVKKKLTGLSDGVNAPTRPATQTFPYLAPAN